METKPVTAEHLTSGMKEGRGLFDELMRAATSHLDREFKNNRIVGAEYSQVYLGLMQSAMSTAASYTLGMVKTNADLEVAAQSIESQQIQNDLNTRQTDQDILNKKSQIEVNDQQILASQSQIKVNDAQILSIEAQTDLYEQKLDTEIANTSDTIDGDAIGGVVGKQMALYQAQADGFLRDAEQKVLKILSDAWAVRTTVDESDPPSSGMDDPSLLQTLNVARAGIGLQPYEPLPPE